jgi:hypothetical protein
VTDTFVPAAVAIGEAWANELVRGFKADDRKVIGAWPGTMSEARKRVLFGLRVRLDSHLLDDLAKVASVAARREWRHATQPLPGH